MNLLELYIAGGITMHPMLALSLLSLAVTYERWVVYRSAKGDSSA